MNSKLQLANITINSDFKSFSKKRIANVDYQVYPCIMLVEGVHHGVGTDPVYYSPAVIENSAAQWNNMPVTIGHPILSDGTHVLCNHDGTIRTEWQVGYVSNVKFDNGKLKADLFINIALCSQKQPELLTFLANGGQLDVSTGMLAADNGTAGNWNGEDFSAEIIEIIPDHLALLPNSTGACSWNDGCGVRFNKTNDVNEEDNSNEGDVAKNKTAIKETIMAKAATPAEKAKCAEKAATPADKAKCKEMTVNAMIENQDNAFTEEDRTWLNSLDDTQFSKLVANAEPKEVIVEKIVEKVTTNTAAPVDMTAYLASAPAEIRAVLNAGLRELDSKRATLMSRIMTKEGNKFNEGQLKDMDLSTLEAIVALIPVENTSHTSFAARVPADMTINQDGGEEPYQPATLSLNLGKK